MAQEDTWTERYVAACELASMQLEAAAMAFALFMMEMEIELLAIGAAGRAAKAEAELEAKRAEVRGAIDELLQRRQELQAELARRKAT